MARQVGWLVTAAISAALSMSAVALADAQIGQSGDTQPPAAAVDPEAVPDAGGAAPVMLGLLAGFAVMYATGMLVG